MKLLNGTELAEFIQERQARQVRALRQAMHVQPKLAIVVTIDDPTINVYTRMKKKYGADLLIDVDVHQVTQDEAPELIKELNEDPAVHGIIVQLPLERSEETDQLVALVTPEKDVDGLGKDAKFDPATPLAILWLLAGYAVDFPGKKVLLVGRGKLVGAPLERMLLASGVDVSVADRTTADLKAETLQADIIITATGSPAILTSDMIKQGAVVVDAGVAGEEGKTVGDVAPEVYERDDLTLTPVKGGVGPLTVCALMENVITAAHRAAERAEQAA
ncbi:MAG TPA: bifunctional 5,10-methylenetetrahydrofolate dehydrogenase/5,10-methenyltetrahydrofolate cyclohydrolase [Candidatus Saccharimonadales bacterium]|jgi:methylenetetrahydrofolate dehydrogenase (NADP+)/methenyltetrahydrofolate cyclohydrolase|nr:bifunctional 5,10-methylenetetrahydrofolate dehydrogenase/5,10-methenyltetrahydrofolate cyclohydrolase [Candidatus Saccharimonadales bacterium]